MNQHSEVVNILSQDQKHIYQDIQSNIMRIVDNERKLILAHQKIILDQYDSQPCNVFISKLYKQILGVQYVGEIPPSLVLLNRYNNFHTRPLVIKKNIQKNSSYKNIERVYNKRFYENLNVDENRTIYKFQEQTKTYLMDLDNKQQSYNLQTVKILFTIFTQTERKQVSEQLLKLAELYIYNFQQKALGIFQKAFDKPFNDFSQINIQNSPLLTMLLNKVYYDAQIINRQHRRVLNCTRASKYNSRVVAFVNDMLIYNNLEYYLSNDLKKKIIQSNAPIFNDVIQQLEFTEQCDTLDILVKKQIQGYHNPSHKRWSLYVNKSMKFVQLTFQIQASRCFGGKDVDQRAYLDLFAMVAKIIEAPLNSQKNLKSQKGIIYRDKMDQHRRSSFFGLQSILLAAFDFAPKINYESFEFNILDYDVQTTIRIVYQMLYSRFKQMGLHQQKLQKFIKQIGKMYQYKENAFHNVYHAFTVLHGSYIISKSQIFGEVFDDEIALTFMIAAYCHDVCHTGVTNYFEQKTTSKLANRYGDRSILQFNSIAKSLNLLTLEQFDFLAYMSEKSWINFRKLFIESILATDNKYHFQTYSNLQSALSENNIVDSSQTSAIIGGLLHTADFWGVVKDYKVSYAWSKMVNTQFANQFQREAELQIQQTPYFKDLDNDMVIAKNQQAFVISIVSPLFKKVNEWTSGYMNLSLQRIDQNISIWKKIQSGEQEVAKYI